MNAQKELLQAGGSILALAGAVAKLRAKFSEQGTEKAKQSYSKTATTKKQNKELTEKKVNIVEEKEEVKEIVKPAPKSFGIEAVITDNNDEQKIAEKKVQGFGELPTVSEVTAEASETNIPANDPDVQGLMEVKQKNAKRAAAGRKSQAAYIASKGYEKDFPIRDYLPNVEDKELYKAGITKTELNKLSSILAGNGTEEDIQNWFKKHNASDTPVINVDSLTVSEDTAKEIKRLILDKDTNLEEKQPESSEWYDNFTRETSNYKVWEDQEVSEEELPETDRNFSGIVF